MGFNTLAIETGTGESDKEGYANSEKYTTFTNRVYKADGTYTTASADVPEFDRGVRRALWVSICTATCTCQET